MTAKAIEFLEQFLDVAIRMASAMERRNELETRRLELDHGEDGADEPPEL